MMHRSLAATWKYAFLALLALLLAGPALAQSAERLPEDSELADRIRERFDVIVLSDGVLLESRYGDGMKAIEVAPGRIALDGRRIENRSRLFEHLGDDARLVVELSGLEADRLHGLFGESSFSDRPPAAPEMELEIGAPRRPDAPASPSDREIPIRVGNVEIGTANISSDTKVVVGGELIVPEGERYRDVVVVGGSLQVDGEVRGDAAVFGGPAYIDGRVTGDVMAIGGSVDLGENADVEGDVTSVGGEVDREPGSRVGGRVSELSMLGPMIDLDHLENLFDRRDRSGDRSWFHFGRIWSRIWHLMGLAFLAFMACVVKVLAPKLVDRIDSTTEEEPWKAAFVGFAAVLLFIPFLVTLAVVLTISIIGIPLLLLLPFVCLAFVVAGFIGFVGVAQRLGRWGEVRFGLELGPLAAVLAGVVAICIWSLLGEFLGIGGWPLTFFAIMLSIFGGLIEVAACSVGLGGVILSRFGSDREASLGSGFAPPPAPGFMPPVDAHYENHEDSEDNGTELSELEDIHDEATDDPDPVDELQADDDELDLSDLELPKSVSIDDVEEVGDRDEVADGEGERAEAEEESESSEAEQTGSDEDREV